MDHNSLRAEYLAAEAHFAELHRKEEKRINLLSLLRLFVFVAGIVSSWAVLTKSILPGVILAILFISAFLFLLRLYLSASLRKEYFFNLSEINRNEALALEGDISSFRPGTSYVDIKHDFSYDTDVFGEASLFQYLNRTVTEYGSDILAGWLSDPYTLSKKLAARQSAISELVTKKSWRQSFLAKGMSAPLKKNDITGLSGWMNEESPVSRSVIHRIFIYFLPVMAMLTLALTISGIIQYVIFISIVLLNLLYVAQGLRKINRIHSSVSKKYNFLVSLTALLESFENERFESDVLKDIKSGISGECNSAASSVKKLGKLIQAFDSRNNMLIGTFLNGMLLWDYHLIHRLDKWKEDYRKSFPLWLEMIGQADAYISLGNYGYNNPDFVYPIESETEMFSAKDLGHQLIAPHKRVCNDFKLGRKGTICIISGANMAGKSTFLRTVAVNFILAMTGAPVCAKEMHFIPALLFTSMRTMDSLPANESYFYAELRRLNLLKKRIEEGEPVLFILDEILKGTNSADKTTGSRLFLEKLAKRGGTGLLATHDTSLGSLEDEFRGVIINKCFEIEIDGEIIRFDYKIRDGITKKMNAVLLMKQMGILD
jgi:hypothetical protein